MDFTTKYQSIVFMGKIASGKGTQAAAVIKHFGGTLYSNGDKLRATAALETAFGKKMKETYEGGLMMPEWIASYWMTDVLVREHDIDRVVFEAVAKKPNEAELFHEIHDWLHRPYVVFNLQISDAEVHARSLARARDVVDTPQSIEKRLEAYHTYTDRSIEFFRTKGTLIDIDGGADPAFVQEKVFTYLRA